MHPYAVYTAEGLSVGHKMKNGTVAQLFHEMDDDDVWILDERREK